MDTAAPGLQLPPLRPALRLRGLLGFAEALSPGEAERERAKTCALLVERRRQLAGAEQDLGVLVVVAELGVGGNLERHHADP